MRPDSAAAIVGGCTGIVVVEHFDANGYRAGTLLVARVAACMGALFILALAMLT